MDRFFELLGVSLYRISRNHSNGLDRESSFSSNKFRENAEGLRVELQFSGIEAHISIGKGERFHHQPRRILNILCSAKASLEKHSKLKIYVKSINDNMSPNGLVPSFILFGVLPSFPSPTKSSNSKLQRLRALQKARAEMERILSQARIRTALNTKIPPARRYLIRAEDKVRIYRETRRNADGPVTIKRVADKIIYVKDGINVKQFNITQVLPMVPKSNDPNQKDDMTKMENIQHTSAII